MPREMDEDGQDRHRPARLAGPGQRQALRREHRARRWPPPIRRTPPTTRPMPTAYLSELASTDAWVRAELAKVPAGAAQGGQLARRVRLFRRGLRRRVRGAPGHLRGRRAVGRRPQAADRPDPRRAHQGAVPRERAEPAPDRADRRARPAPGSAARSTRMRCRRPAAPPTPISACSATTSRCCATPCWPAAGRADVRAFDMAMNSQSSRPRAATD